MEIRETEDGYTLGKVTKDGKKVQDNDTFTVTCLATSQCMGSYPADESIVFNGGDTDVYKRQGRYRNFINNERRGC